jgi:hypothetical protein
MTVIEPIFTEGMLPLQLHKELVHRISWKSDEWFSSL